MTPVFERLPDSFFRQHPRRFHAFCVGAPRSGTVSIANLFPYPYRAAHEPESRFLTNRIVAHQSGEMGAEAMLRYVQRRDRRLQLEIDSSYLNGEIVEFLVRAFPQAKFILTLRDCLSWAESFTNFLLNKPEFVTRKRYSQRHMILRFGEPPYTYAPQERVLAELGLHPIQQYLRYWRYHNLRVLDTVPADRLLIVKTAEIGESTRRLEAFLNLPPGSLKSKIHSNSSPVRHSILKRIDSGYLYDSVMECCRDLMERFFPEALRPTGEAVVSR